MTKEEKQALLNTLENAIYSGYTRIKNADKEINYTSTAEMKKLRDELRSELGITPTRSKRIFASHSKGLAE